MNFDKLLPALSHIGGLVVAYIEPVLFGAGAVGVLLAVGVLWRFLRTGYAHEKLGKVAVFLATLFAMEGMFEVASGPLDLNIAGSLMFCATFEIVMLHQGTLAAHKLAADPRADIRRHMSFVWIVAGLSGLIASTASNSPTEVVLRLATPPLAAGIWYMSLYADKDTGPRQSSQWIWTPQRIGVHWGLLKPGAADDLTDVFRRRRVAAMVNSAVIVWHNKPKDGEQLQDKKAAKRLEQHTRKLQNLAKEADQQALNDVRQQLQITLGIQAHLFDGLTPSGQRERLDDRIADELARIREQSHNAATKLRSQHQVAFGNHWSAGLHQDRPLIRPEATTLATRMANPEPPQVAIASAPAGHSDGQESGHAGGREDGQDDADLLAMVMATQDAPAVATSVAKPVANDGQERGHEDGQPGGQQPRRRVVSAVAKTPARKVATAVAKPTDDDTKKRDARIKRLAGKPGMTDQEIAAQVGVSTSTVRRVLGKKR